jgi:threonyl-tRNA synthetase
MTEAGLRVEVDTRNEKIGYKIREHEVKKVPYMLVVGEKEKAVNSVSLRQHKKGDIGVLSVDEVIQKLLQEN